MNRSVEVGRKLAGYSIESVLGRGGMGVVYLATHERLGRKAALKVLPDELADDPDFRARFEHESRLAASLDHPNVVDVYDAGESDGALYIAMRYVRGTDLETMIHEQGPLAPEVALGIVGQVASALDAAHDLGLVHRDVKPSNILLTRDAAGAYHAYLADFGLTKKTVSIGDRTKTGQFLGSIHYSSPEQIEGRFLDGRSDQYSLGCVLYFCLTGKRPFERDSEVAVLYAHLKDSPPWVSAARPEIPERLDHVVARALAKSASARHDTCAEFAEAAAGALGTEVERRDLPGRLGWLISPKLLVAGLLIIAAIAAGLVRVLGGGEETARSGGVPTKQLKGVLEIDPATNEIGDRAPIPNAFGVQLGEGFLWVVDPGHLYKVNPDTGSIVAEFENSFKGLTVGYRAVWTFIDYQSPRDGLLRIDPRTNQVSDRIPGLSDIYGIDTGYGAVWAATSAYGELLRVENGSRRIVKRIPVESTQNSPRSVAAGEGAVWVVDISPAVVSRIDPSTNQVVATIPIEGARAVEAGLGAVWVTTDQGSVVVLNPATNTPLTTIETGKGSTSGIAIGAGSVWVVNSDEGTVARIDPSSYEIEARIPVGENGGDISADGDQVWVAGGAS